MSAQLAQLEMTITQFDADQKSPITKQATCAVFRQVLIPLLDGEIKATGTFGFAARWALGKVKQLLQQYVDRNCPA